jgi:hypothetical protein
MDLGGEITMAFMAPILIHFPNAITGSIARIPIAATSYVREVGGSLRVLTSGTYTVQVRNRTTQEVLGQLSWNAAGDRNVTDLNVVLLGGEGLEFVVTSGGVGALDCYIILWLMID